MLRNYLAVALRNLGSNKVSAAINIILFSALANANGSLTLTLDEAVRIALKNNLTLQQAEIASALEDAAVGDARSQFLPDLGFGVSGSESYGRTFSEREGRIINDTTRSVSVGASSSVTLFNGFRDLAALRGAKSNSRAGKLELQRARETLISAVSDNFFELLDAREQLQVQRERLEAEAELERQIEIYVEGGSRTRADLYAQQVNLANARLAVTESERTAELARLDLLETLKVDLNAVYEFEAPTAADLALPDDLSSVGELVQQALRRRADLMALSARAATAEQQVRVARAGWWPSLALSAGYGSGFTNASPLRDSEQLDLNRGGSTGLNLSWSLFDGGATRRAARRAHLQLRSARLDLEEARRQIEQQVRRAHLDYRIAGEQLDLAVTRHRSAELAMQISQDRYELGAATLVELSQARANFVLAESALASARLVIMQRHNTIGYAVGNIGRDLVD